MKLTEECKKHECSCENCNFYPLKHFQKCPKCYSEAFHSYTSKEDVLDEENAQ